MSIETLLEAAKFLELQAQQQQKTREENELRERLWQEQEAEQQRRRAEVASHAQSVRAAQYLAWAEQASPERRPAPAAPPPPPSSLPIAVIPIPVVTSAPMGLATPPTTTALSAPAAPRVPPPKKDPHSPPPQHALHQRAAIVPPQPRLEPATPLHPAGAKQHQQHPTPALLQPYQGSIVTASQHALLPQPGQQGPPPLPPMPAQTSPPDDGRHLDGKKRPGGAGTREVHNKLEKNRRAHLKECFETLKKNIPNVDEKKTSNLSVLRSALRYIQTLKRKEKEYEHEMERLAREKIATQQRLAELKKELSQWMDVMEVDRVLRQTVQPEDDQASTSTASEGEDNIEEDVDEERMSATPSALPKVPHALQPELRKSLAHPPVPPHPVVPRKLSPTPPAGLPALVTAPAIAPAPPSVANGPPPQPSPPARPVPAAHAHIVAAPPGLQPTVIAHAAAPSVAASHASVIQAVNHIIHAGGAKHVAHIAPASAAHVVPSSSSNSVQLAPAPQPIGHITVHPVAHLGAHLPAAALYPQPAVMGHIAHTLAHGPVNGTTAAAAQQAGGVVTHHPQLVGQTVLNPVTMVTMPSFPVSTLKLA